MESTQTFEYGLLRLGDLRLLSPSTRADNPPGLDSSSNEPPQPIPQNQDQPTAIAPVPVAATEAVAPPAPAKLATAALQRQLRQLPLSIHGETVEPTNRFWRSFFHRFSISEAVFRYFQPEEVLERIVERSGNEALRFTLRRPREGRPQLLAVTSPQRSYLPFTDLAELLERQDAELLSIHDGVVTSCHSPRSGLATFHIGGDAFQNRYLLEAPIDGFGEPRIYLALLRLVCENGAVGYTRTFRSDIAIGKQAVHSVARALETFDHSDGYAALRDRFQAAQQSWASVHECQRLYKMLSRLQSRGLIQHSKLRIDLNRVTGDLQGMYGLANLDALSSKRQRILPARCRVYDLLNFTSELATHHTTGEASRYLQALLGEMIADEFDLEGTVQKVPDFDDFFIDDSPNSPSKN